MQLAEWQPRFEAIGVAVAAMTYDERELSAAFHAKHALPYPVLQDEGVKHFDAYGVRNERYQPGQSGYGVPHPGVLFISPEGIVELKFAAPGFKERPSFKAIYTAVKGKLNLSTP